MRATVLLVGALLTGGAHNQPQPAPIHETSYDCSLSEKAGSLTLNADLNVVGWIEEIDGIGIQGNLSFLTAADSQQFQQTGFDNLPFQHPIAFFDYPPELRADASGRIAGKSLTSFVGGARVGERHIEQRAAINGITALDWAQIQYLLGGEGDMFVSLYDVSGRDYKTIRIPREHFSDIERRLQALHADVLIREADREHLCPVSTHEVQELILIG